MGSRRCGHQPADLRRERRPVLPAPALQFDAVSIKGLFTAGNISEGTFQVQMLDPEDREPVQVSVKYREERANNSINNPGVFPTERELLVREAGSSDTDPIEALDLSDYCTNRDHAIDAAKYLIRMRRIPTHTIKFQTTYEGVLARLAPSDYIQVVMDVHPIRRVQQRCGHRRRHPGQHQAPVQRLLQRDRLEREQRQPTSHHHPCRQRRWCHRNTHRHRLHPHPPTR
jgi:hypothetical protein